MNKEDNAINTDTSQAPRATAEGPEALAPEQIEELKQNAAKAAEHWDRLLRTTADFDNYKKRVAREKQEAIKYANESLIGKMLPLLDNFEMAIAAAQANESETTRALHQGVGLVFQQFKQILKDAGVEEIDARDAVFDPNLHEAVSTMESTDKPEGTVLQQMRKGYKLRDRLLRPASVIVARPPTQTNP